MYDGSRWERKLKLLGEASQQSRERDRRAAWTRRGQRASQLSHFLCSSQSPELSAAEDARRICRQQQKKRQLAGRLFYPEAVTG